MSKIMVLPKSGKKFNMDEVTLDMLHDEFKVPQGLFSMATKLVPTLFDIGNFSIDVPMFDTKKKILSLKIAIKSDGVEKYQVKFKVSFGDSPHEVAVTTDGGQSWKTLSYSGPKEKEYAVGGEADINKGEEVKEEEN